MKLILQNIKQKYFCFVFLFRSSTFASHLLFWFPYVPVVLIQFYPSFCPLTLSYSLLLFLSFVSLFPSPSITSCSFTFSMSSFHLQIKTKKNPSLLFIYSSPSPSSPSPLLLLLSFLIFSPSLYLPPSPSLLK